ncbi:hypothetical protein D3C72_1495680 [compost metagenome]
MSHARLDRGQWIGHRMRQHRARPHLPAQHVEKGRLRWYLLATQQVGIEQWTMKCHETGITTDRQMHGSDVAVTDEWLGIVAQQLEIDAIKQPGRAVTSAQADDGIDFTIRERSVQVIEPHVVAAGQVAVFLVDPGKHFQ